MAVKQSDAGARRTRRRLLPTLWFIALVSTGIIVGFAGTGGTYAAWNSSATVSGATITTGSTTIVVGKGANPTFASSYALGPVSNAIGPGDTAASSFTVKNTGTTPVTLSATITLSTQANDLTNALSAGVVAVPTEASCSSASGTANTPLASPAPIDITHVAAGATQSLCLLLTLPATAPNAAQGQTAPFTLTLTGTQAAS
ncbi:SipW-dependent-type signal peptide-containing protein [Gryllotalpicola protaetiae]|uniref:Ribosomally synthesized peptide with SipW-like signal peptide n=1 Tax=Gryllotalpicola protaetiae TaxID=2419771 RepID=A0A387BSZ9_9MICO|nr:SipW-dependent-type signal peptide-containing protein [Gryllotalpicola protaetiae]AYG04166.1 hypothetical protein D7I44_11920 [Gryllotalpicola protaetiae]